MPQGDRRKDIDLYDMTYDGDVIQPTPLMPSASGGSSGIVGSGEVGALVAPVRLSAGLGQLTDGDEGQSNFRLDPRVTGSKGERVVGESYCVMNIIRVKINLTESITFLIIIQSNKGTVTVTWTFCW